MTLLDRHVFREWLRVFSVIVIAMIGLLVIEDMARNLRDFLDHDAGFVEFIYYYVVVIPSRLPIVLNIALLLSLLYSLGQLHRSNEITAMRAAGLGLLRITRPLWVAGFILAAIAWMLNSSLIPWSVEKARVIRAGLAHADDTISVVPGVGYHNMRDGRIWFFNRLSERTHHGYGVTLSVLGKERAEQRRIVAKQAFYDSERRGWIFLWGRELVFDATGREVRSNEPFAEKFLAGFSEDPQLMLLLGKSADDLSLNELAWVAQEIGDAENPQQRMYQVQLEKKRAAPAALLVVVALAVPFAVTGVRVNPAVGVSKSIGLFFGYYILNSLSLVLGERGLVDPLIGAWLPNGVMAAVAGWLWLRLR